MLSEADQCDSDGDEQSESHVCNLVIENWVLCSLRDSVFQGFVFKIIFVCSALFEINLRGNSLGMMKDTLVATKNIC